LAIDVARRLAGHSDRDGVDRALAGRGRDDQLATTIGGQAGGRDRTIGPTLRWGLPCRHRRYWARHSVVVEASGADTGCRVQRGGNDRYHAGQLRIAPLLTAVGRYAADRDRARAAAKPIVPGNALLVERRGRRARTAEGRVRNDLGALTRRIVVTEAADDQVVTRSTHPGSRATTVGIARHRGNGRGQVRVFAVGQVIPVGEGLGRDHRRIHVLGLARHEGRLVTEVAVRRV